MAEESSVLTDPFEAVSKNDLQSLRALLETPDAIDTVDSNGNNLLLYSIISDNRVSIGYLLSFESLNVDHTNANKECSLLLVLQKIANHNSKHSNEDEMNECESCAYYSDLFRDLIVTHNANINVQSSDGSYLVHYAITNELRSVIEYLFTGSNKYVLDYNVVTAQTNESIFHLLVKTKHPSWANELIVCIKNEQQRLEKENRGSEIMTLQLDILDNDQCTALYQAIDNEQYDMAESLCNYGADINVICSDMKRTVAHLIFMKWPTGDVPYYTLLDKYKARLGVKDANGKMPLELAQETYQRVNHIDPSTVKADTGGCGFEIFMEIGRAMDGKKAMAAMSEEEKSELAKQCPHLNKEKQESSDKPAATSTGKCPYPEMHGTASNGPLQSVDEEEAVKKETSAGATVGGQASDAPPSTHPPLPENMQALMANMNAEQKKEFLSQCPHFANAGDKEDVPVATGEEKRGPPPGITDGCLVM